eukprot:Opistho-2@63507
MAPGSHTVAAYNTQRQHSTTEAQEASPATLPLAPGHLQADVPIRPGHVHRVPGSHLVFLVRQGDHVDYPAVNLITDTPCAIVHVVATNDDIQHLGRPRELDTVPAFRLLRPVIHLHAC